MNVKNCIAFVMLFTLVVSIVVAADPAGTVVGTVVDAEKKGVEEVDVSIYTADNTKMAIATTTTSTDGKFTLKDVPPGENYVLKAVKRNSRLGVRAEKADVAVENGKTTDVGELEVKVPTKK